MNELQTFPSYSLSPELYYRSLSVHTEVSRRLYSAMKLVGRYQASTTVFLRLLLEAGKVTLRPLQSAQTRRYLRLRIYAVFAGASTTVGVRYCHSAEPTRYFCLISIRCNRRGWRRQTPISQTRHPRSVVSETVRNFCESACLFCEI